MLKKISLIIVCLLASLGAHAQSWYNLRNGADALNANGDILTICTDTQNNIYAAGYGSDGINPRFGYKQVWKWDAGLKHWSQLGSGINAINANDDIRTICADKFGNIYAGGSFYDSINRYQYVAKWNGANWSKVDGWGLNAHGVIKTISDDETGNVYVAGNFRSGTGRYYVAKWDGVNWVDLGHLNANLYINSICVDKYRNVYAAGNFMDDSGHAYVAKYSPTTDNWSVLGRAFDSSGHELVFTSIVVDTNSKLYAGLLCNNGGVHSTIVCWNGINWTQLGDLYKEDEITCVTIRNNDLYTSGSFKNSFGKTYVAHYSMITGVWDELGASTNIFTAHPSSMGAYPYILSLAVSENGGVYAAGMFTDSISPSNIFCFVAAYGNPPASLTTSSHASTQLYTYPNPASGQITVLGLPITPTAYTLLSSDGRVVASGYLSNQSKTIDVHHLKPGLYNLFVGGSCAAVEVK